MGYHQRRCRHREQLYHPHGPSSFADPRKFNPDRYENDFHNRTKSAQNSDPSRQDHFAFGNRRRLCQSMYVAERSLYLAMSRLLWGFHRTRGARDGYAIAPGSR